MTQPTASTTTPICTLLEWYQFNSGCSILVLGDAVDTQPAVDTIKSRAPKSTPVAAATLSDILHKPHHLNPDYIIVPNAASVEKQSGWLEMLSDIFRLLPDNGVLLLATPNSLRLSSWAGHTSKAGEGYFDTITSKPTASEAKSVGKNALQKSVTAAGFTVESFYYPYPSAKAPALIYSDAYAPGKNAAFSLSTLPISGDQQLPVALFSEQLAMLQIEQNQGFELFAEAFLVVAKKGSPALPPQPAFVVYSSNRLPEFQIATSIARDQNNNQLTVTKRALRPSGSVHIAAMQDHYTELSSLATLTDAVTIVQPLESRQTDDAISFPFVEGTGVDRLLLDSILAGNQKESLAIIDRFVQITQALPATDAYLADSQRFESVFGVHPKTITADRWLHPALVDLNLDNIIQAPDGRWHLIDYEWMFDCAMPDFYAVGRMLWWFFGHRYGEIMRIHSVNLDCVELAPYMVMPRYIYEHVKQHLQQLETITVLESGFLHYVTGAKQASDHKPYKKVRSVTPYSSALQDYQNRLQEVTQQAAAITELTKQVVAAGDIAKEIDRVNQIFKQLSDEHSKLQAQYSQLSETHTAIITSRSYRLTKKATDMYHRLFG